MWSIDQSDLGEFLFPLAYDENGWAVRGLAIDRIASMYYFLLSKDDLKLKFEIEKFLPNEEFNTTIKLEEKCNVYIDWNKSENINNYDAQEIESKISDFVKNIKGYPWLESNVNSIIFHTNNAINNKI